VGPAAAGPTVGPRPGGPAPAGVPAGTGSPAADGVFPRTVGHFGGSTAVPAAPQRVVVIATGQLDSVLTLGQVPVGAAAGEGAAAVPAYIASAFPQQVAALQRIAPVGTRIEPDMEALVVAKPDLILANKAASEAIYPRLSAIAPTVLTEGTGVNWKQDFLLIAAALGRTGAAERFLSEYHARGLRLGQSVAAAPPAISMVRFNPGRTRVFGLPSFGGSIAYDAGLGRPAGQQFAATSQDLGPEQTARMDGDWIFYSVQGEPGKTAAPEVLSGPLWAGLAAVKSGHAVQVDDDPWYLNAGPAAALVVLEDLERSLGRPPGAR